MKISLNGVALMHRFEELRLESYPDPKTGGDPWTIGWGHTGADVYPGLLWTPAQADKAFEEDVAFAEQAVDRAVAVVLKQCEFDAMVSIVFNVGPGSSAKSGIIRLRNGSPSTLLRKLNDGDREGAADQFLAWRSPGSSVEKGLRFRRRCERALFLGKDWNAEYAKGP